MSKSKWKRSDCFRSKESSEKGGFKNQKNIWFIKGNYTHNENLGVNI